MATEGLNQDHIANLTCQGTDNVIDNLWNNARNLSLEGGNLIYTNGKKLLCDLQKDD